MIFHTTFDSFLLCWDLSDLQVLCNSNIGQVFKIKVLHCANARTCSNSYLSFNMAISVSTVVLTWDIVMLEVAVEVWPAGVTILLGVLNLKVSQNQSQYNTL